MKTLLTYLRSRKKAPNGQPWNYLALSGNPHLTWQLMQENPDLPWNYSVNPNVTEEIIRANPQIPWDWHCLSSNSRLSFEFFYQARDQSQIEWLQVISCSRLTFSPALVEKIKAMNVMDKEEIFDYLASNRCLTLADILAYPQYEWERRSLSNNPNLTLEFILRPPLWVTGKWDWCYLSANPNLTYAQMKEYSGLPWDDHSILYGKAISEEDALFYLGQAEWMDVTGLAENSGLSWAFCLSHPLLSTAYQWLSRNRNFRLEELLGQSPEFLSQLNWTHLLRHLRGLSYEAQLTSLQIERQNPLSYWSLLPSDMLQHYLGRFFD